MKLLLFILTVIAAPLLAAPPDCLSRMQFNDDGSLAGTTCFYEDPTYGSINWGVRFSTSTRLTLDAGGNVSDPASFRGQIRAAYLVRKAELDGLAARDAASAPHRARMRTAVPESALR